MQVILIAMITAGDAVDSNRLWRDKIIGKREGESLRTEEVIGGKEGTLKIREKLLD